MSTFSQERVLREPILLILIMVHGYPDSQVRVNKTVDARQPKHLFTNSEFTSADQKTTCIYMHATTVRHTSKQESILELIWIVSCMQLQFVCNDENRLRITYVQHRNRWSWRPPQLRGERRLPRTQGSQPRSWMRLGKMPCWNVEWFPRYLTVST